MGIEVMNRGRPKKPESQKLIERMTARLTPKDRAMLEEIAMHKGLAPESLLRSYMLPAMREEHNQLFGNDNSALTA